MGLFDWLKRLRNREAPDYPIPEGGIDALRADQAATERFGITPEEAERMAKREDLTDDGQ